jgi:hypothetical protein
MAFMAAMVKHRIRVASSPKASSMWIGTSRSWTESRWRELSLPRPECTCKVFPPRFFELRRESVKRWRPLCSFGPPFRRRNRLCEIPRVHHLGRAITSGFLGQGRASGYGWDLGRRISNAPVNVPCVAVYLADERSLKPIWRDCRANVRPVRDPAPIGAGEMREV